MTTNIAGTIQCFFENYLVSQRALSTHTVLAYRDTIKLLLLFTARYFKKSCVDITVQDISRKLVLQFLEYLEHERKNTARSRNARLAAIHSLFRYLAAIDPRFMSQCQEIIGIPFKRYNERTFDYLERDEVMSVFKQIDYRDRCGRRDNALLRVLYNTGMRAQELVSLNANHVRFSQPYQVRIMGKGHKERTCPLWLETVRALKDYLKERVDVDQESRPLFVNSRGGRLSRFGLRHIIATHILKTAKSQPALMTRRITPHTFRHTTAMHLLQSGVDINMIRSWLGHSSIETTHTYVEIDLEMKRKTLQSCENLLPKNGKHRPSWVQNRGILEWLSAL